MCFPLTTEINPFQAFCRTGGILKEVFTLWQLFDLSVLDLMKFIEPTEDPKSVLDTLVFKKN